MPRVGLFVTCLVDCFRPSVGFAALRLLNDAGCEVTIPLGQTCCGQPAYNSGRSGDAKDLAKATIEAFDNCDYVVAPSASCAGMLKLHYPELLAGEADWVGRARAFAARCYELTSFLADVHRARPPNAKLEARAVFHDSCSALRELRIRDAPRQLLAGINGLTLCEIGGGEQCCGFGGTFCVKYPEISARIGKEKIESAAKSGASLFLSGDLGCLLHLAGLASREGVMLKFRHVAEILVGDVENPAIGDGQP